MKLRRLVAACASLVLLGTLPVAPADAAPAFQNYVALGDSYTSAPLVPLPDLLSLGCVRSYSNYPKMLAAALRVRIQGKDINLLRALNYHPRYEGQAGVASLIYKTLAGAPAVVTAAEQEEWAAHARVLARQASASPQALEASLNRVRTSAQR